MQIDNRKIFPNEKLKNICYIKNLITKPNIEVGDYTYYNSLEAENFESDCVVYHYEALGDKLIIGKFCSLGEHIRFIMNAANHNMSAFTTYPFAAIIGTDGDINTKHLSELPMKGNTVIGNDVWIGENVTILPGVHIGDGAIIGSNSVVAKNIPPYSVAAGNPCQVKRKRFDDETIAFLLNLKWWDWSSEKIFANIDILCGCDIQKLKLLQ